MTLTRKWFRAIAQAIHESIPDQGTREQVAVALIKILSRSNERFCSVKFYDAVVGGLES